LFFLSFGCAFVSNTAADLFGFFKADLGVPRFGGVMVAGLVVSFGMVILVNCLKYDSYNKTTGDDALKVSLEVQIS
jgi:hypothetical protein